MFRKMIFLFFALALFADKIEINAKYFEGSQKSGFGIFKQVLIKDGSDFLKCDTLKVSLNKANQITAYMAYKVKDFKISLKDKVFSGKCDELKYSVDKKLYELSGNVAIKQDDKLLKAQKIIIDQVTQSYKITSDAKEPVKIFFEIAK